MVEFLRIYLVLGTLLEVVSFLLPTVTDPSFDAVPAVRRLYALYVLTLATLRFATACDMTNAALFGALSVAHVMEAAYSVLEVLVFADIPAASLLTLAHAPKTGMLAILIAQMLFIGTGYFRYVVPHSSKTKYQ
ncbi:hypothetical protein SPRG_00924 [Saprolegnia parasitica CBS 223.65]|uniref:Very-long-chain (3R)-3-hydroxyacyl-CoA dehydratase n=1 Tax=Saprolegnia parasitica (strain CBS 223.65) TaxID=695850 RepID=A0A067CVY3_SAPPC|nr:hypothetical protein SPRG_00924 [Saprolegnia parasitica CBS 223.65]KDO34864.1 hypothetical protein SPRG_00924 [Saprolegnia parasitica CBS 223.65]|eukprot:XP_012194526.1 hypothetical protein SPRG_00924 [Saprolegnia parasitica CBS 223.65]